MTARSTSSPGQYFDSETGLHQNYFRDYDPKTGRYIEPDPSGLAGGVNLYEYVSANPLARIDPLGLWEAAWWGKWFPGQTYNEHMWTSIENGQLRMAALYLGAMTAEELLFVLTLGECSAISGGLSAWAERQAAKEATSCAAKELAASSATNSALLRNQLVAEEIAGGHAFEKHVIQQAEFPGITTRGQFASEIERLLNSPDTISPNLINGRQAFWNDTTKSILIRDPAAFDDGTFFRPRAGIDFFWQLR